MVRTNGQAILSNVSAPIQGPIYFTTASGATIVGAMLASLQQIVSSFNTGSTDFIFRNNTSTGSTTTTTVTTYTFNPTVTPYITSNSGQSFSAGFVSALVQALNNYNANQQQANQIILIYSNGQIVDTTSTTSTTFFGPIYFLTYSGQQLSLSALAALQQIVSGLTQQWSVLYYSNSQQQSTGVVTSTSDPNCARFQGNTNNCAVCSTRFYLSSRTGRCTSVSNQCNTYDQNNGVCLSCYQGYTLSNGDCYVLVSQDSSSDPYCKTVGSNGVCQECYQGYFYSSGQFKCIISNPQCKTTTQLGSCGSCYAGYVLLNGNCLIQQSTAVGNCRTFTNGVCYECSNGYIQSNGRCLPVNPQCKTYSNQTGECLSCYSGYILSNGNCVVGGASPSGDPSCRTYDQYGNCQYCSERFYKLNGRCTQVSDYCNTYDTNTGRCLTCYRGYTLQNNDCYKTLIVQQPAQPAIVQQQGVNSLQANQQTTVSQQGSADLQFGVVTVPVDSGTVVTSTLPSGVNIGGLTSGSTTTTTTTTTNSTSSGNNQGSTGTFPGYPVGTPDLSTVPITNTWSQDTNSYSPQTTASNSYGSTSTGSQYNSNSGYGSVLPIGVTSSADQGGVVTTNNTTVTTVVSNQGSTAGSALPLIGTTSGGASGYSADSGSQYNTGAYAIPSSVTSNQFTPSPSASTVTSYQSYQSSGTNSGQPTISSVIPSLNSLGSSSGQSGLTSNYQSSSSTTSSSSNNSGSNNSGSTSSGSTTNCKTYTNGVCTDCNDGYLLFASICVPL